MTAYVLVDADGIDKEIKYGPLELASPDDYVVPEGQKLLEQSEAMAEGYYFVAGGAGFAAEQEPAAGEDASDDVAQDPGVHHGHGDHHQQ